VSLPSGPEVERHYPIVSRLSQGGLGVVYRAQDLHPDIPVSAANTDPPDDSNAQFITADPTGTKPAGLSRRLDLSNRLL
jgi:hypothetical protein